MLSPGVLFLGHVEHHLTSKQIKLQLRVEKIGSNQCVSTTIFPFFIDCTYISVYMYTYIYKTSLSVPRFSHHLIPVNDLSLLCPPTSPLSLFVSVL